MPDLDLEPNEYRRKGSFLLRDMSGLVKLATPLGILTALVVAILFLAFPWMPWWMVWGIAFVPGLVLVIVHEAWDGTRIKRATETGAVPIVLPVPPGADCAFPKAGTAEDASQGRPPKGPSSQVSDP
jgi:hypothetical protein